MVRISVIIPAFNRGEGLARAVGSVFRQTHPVSELIVVDDGSDLPIALDALPRGHIEISVVRHTANLGAAAARQTGIEHASGDLIAFLDTDDLWQETKLEKQLEVWNALGKRTLVAVTCGWEHVDCNTGEVFHRIPRPGTTPTDFSSGCWFAPGSTVLLPRRAFAIVGPFDVQLRRLEDLDWFLRFGLAGGELAVAQSIGAAIFRDRTNAKQADIVSAAATIAKKYLVDRVLTNWQERRRLRAWLDVELASMNYRENRLVRAMYYLCRSFALFPRPRYPLQNWWTNRLE